MSAAARTAALALGALALGGCGPYAEVAQKLDVTSRVVGDTWISRGGAGDETRVLIVGAPDANGSSQFAFSSVHVPLSRGGAVYELQGAWVEAGTAGLATLHVEHEYAMPDEGDEGILQRSGTTREDRRYDVELTIARDVGRLTVAGDAGIAGTYVPLVEALRNLPDSTTSEAAGCAFQVANLGMLISEGRIIGFGGAPISQYDTAATYIGTIAGSLSIHIVFSANYQHNETTIAYGGFEEIGGVRVDGPMITNADSSGNGQMSGVMTFAITPVDSNGVSGTPISGTIDYDGGGDPILIRDGNAVDGVYAVAIEGGGTAKVPTAEPPASNVATCLALP